MKFVCLFFFMEYEKKIEASEGALKRMFGRFVRNCIMGILLWEWL